MKLTLVCVLCRLNVTWATEKPNAVARIVEYHKLQREIVSSNGNDLYEI